MHQGQDVQEHLGAFSTFYVDSHTTLLKTSIQNYLLSHSGKVRQSPPLYLIPTPLQKHLDQQVKARVLKPQPGNRLAMGLGGEIQKGEEKGW